MEPTAGFEPATCCLRNSCSTPELRRPSLACGSHVARTGSVIPEFSRTERGRCGETNRSYFTGAGETRSPLDVSIYGSWVGHNADIGSHPSEKRR